MKESFSGISGVSGWDNFKFLTIDKSEMPSLIQPFQFGPKSGWTWIIWYGVLFLSGLRFMAPAWVKMLSTTIVDKHPNPLLQPIGPTKGFKNLVKN